MVRELHQSMWEFPTRQNYMISTLKFWKNLGLSMVILGGLSVMTVPAHAQMLYSRRTIMSAQMRLAAKGYYRGPINGRYNRRTVRALRNFQFNRGIAQTGRLNLTTCSLLGSSCGAMH